MQSSRPSSYRPPRPPLRAPTAAPANSSSGRICINISCNKTALSGMAVCSTHSMDGSFFQLSAAGSSSLRPNHGSSSDQQRNQPAPPPERLTRKPSASIPADDSSDFKFKCKYNGCLHSGSNDLRVLKAHITREHRGGTNKTFLKTYDGICSICGAQLQTTNQLKKHFAEKHANAARECPSCGLKFNGKNRLISKRYSQHTKKCTGKPK
jgi:hypothetical protein